MSSRLDYYSASPKAMKAMIAMEALTSNLSIEPALLHLIKIRASQLNGCAFCTDMHSVDARRLGEPTGACTRSSCGATAAFSTRASALRWPGQKR